MDKSTIIFLIFLLASIKVIVRFEKTYGTIGIIYGIVFIAAMALCIMWTAKIFGVAGLIITLIIFSILYFALID